VEFIGISADGDLVPRETTDLKYTIPQGLDW
jgi:hypothetical protein